MSTAPPSYTEKRIAEQAERDLHRMRALADEATAQSTTNQRGIKTNININPRSRDLSGHDRPGFVIGLSLTDQHMESETFALRLSMALRELADSITFVDAYDRGRRESEAGIANVYTDDDSEQ